MAKDEFELLILLFLFLTCWDYLRAPSSLAYVLLEIESRALSMLESTLLSYILSPRHLLKIPSSSIFFHYILFVSYVCLCVPTHVFTHEPHSRMHGNQRTTCRLWSLFLPFGVWGLNLGRRARWQVPLPHRTISLA